MDESGERIRTLHILTSLNRRGAETFAVQLVDRLSREGVDTAVWTIKPPRSGPDLVPQRTRVLPRPTREGWDRSFLSLLATVRSYRPHLIQCHGGRALKYATLLKPFWRAGVYVYTKIGSVHPMLDHPVKRWFYGLLFEQPDAIVAVGKLLQQEIEAQFHPRRPRLLTVYTGRDVTPFLEVTPVTAAQKRAEIGLAPSDLLLLTVGSLSWEKDPLSLVRHFSDVAQANPRLRLAFAGGGPLAAALEQEVRRRGLEQRVRLLGVRHDVPALLSAADIFVLPSVTEGLPGVLIEAGMAGLPAVAYGVGSVSEVLKHEETGYVVPPKDAATFYRRVLTLAGDGDLRCRMGQAAREFCRRDFDIHRSVQRHEALFTELLAATRREQTGADRWAGPASSRDQRTPLA